MEEQKKLTIYVMNATHWDREWYQTFQGYRYRLVRMVDDLIEKLQSLPEFVFTFDGQTSVLDDYLQLCPHRRAELEQLIREGRILIGPWYVMPDEFLPSGESFIRNLRKGFAVSRSFGVEPWKYGYLCDMFGHTAQMPQILSGFGIRNASLGRGLNDGEVPAFFRWQAPDGTECVTFKQEDMGTYGWIYLNLDLNRTENMTEEQLDELVKTNVDREIARSNVPVVHLTDGSDHQHMHAQILDWMARIARLYPHAEIKMVNLEEMGQHLEAYKDQMPVLKGELSKSAKIAQQVLQHTLSSRYDLKRRNDLSQSKLEHWLEPMTAIASLQGVEIPKAFEDHASLHLLQNQPHDSICGCSVEAVHRDMHYRYDQIDNIVKTVKDDLYLAYRKEQQKHGAPAECVYKVSIFNPLPYERDEVISIPVEFEAGYVARYVELLGNEEINRFAILDEKGEQLPFTITDIQRNVVRRYDRHLCLITDPHQVTVRVKLAPCGVTELKIVPTPTPIRHFGSLRTGVLSAENQWVALQVEKDGTLTLSDKRNGRVYRNLLSFEDGGEVGDGWNHTPGVADRYVTSAGAPFMAEITEDSPLRCVFTITKTLQIPAQMEYHTYKMHHIRRSEDTVALRITARVELDAGCAEPTVRLTVDNTAKDHRLRMVLPTGIAGGEWFCGQSFCTVSRPCGAPEETFDWNEVGVADKATDGILGKRDQDGNGVALVFAYGVHEAASSKDKDGTLYATLLRCFRQTVMTNGETDGQLQGKHEFLLKIVPLTAQISDASLKRMRDCLLSGVETLSVPHADFVPASYSLMRLEGGEGLCHSIIKRPDDGEKNTLVVRVYNNSAESQSGSLVFSGPIVAAQACDLCEENAVAVSADGNRLDMSLAPWKIATWRIHLA
ncbi:MAG: hypothetical protein IKD06_00880 [Clostridia bacterium]|nr:hypothetical protein [Clostridia bacterium]